jgi:hypothetical protein
MALNFRKRSTIQSVIEEGLELKLTIKDLAFKEIIENSSGEKFVVNMFNLYEKYYELLLEHATIVVLTDEEYRKYRFNPRLLSKDLYGTPELHYMLLRLNYVYSILNFDFREVRVFRTNINTLLNEIMVMESEDYIDNEMSILKKINE